MIDAQLVTNLVVMAYNTGLLQYDTLTVKGITVEMKMKTHFNMLTFTYRGDNLAFTVWNTDSDDLTERMIHAIVKELLTA